MISHGGGGPISPCECCICCILMKLRRMQFLFTIMVLLHQLLYSSSGMVGQG
jgi:hypothetical protein